jgi:hypothetical protein
MLRYRACLVLVLQLSQVIWMVSKLSCFYRRKSCHGDTSRMGSGSGVVYPISIMPASNIMCNFIIPHNTIYVLHTHVDPIEFTYDIQSTNKQKLHRQTNRFFLTWLVSTRILSFIVPVIDFIQVITNHVEHRSWFTNRAHWLTENLYVSCGMLLHKLWHSTRLLWDLPSWTRHRKIRSNL